MKPARTKTFLRNQGNSPTNRSMGTDSPADPASDAHGRSPHPIDRLCCFATVRQRLTRWCSRGASLRRRSAPALAPGWTARGWQVRSATRPDRQTLAGDLTPGTTAGDGSSANVVFARNEHAGDEQSVRCVVVLRILDSPVLGRSGEARMTGDSMITLASNQLRRYPASLVPLSGRPRRTRRATRQTSIGDDAVSFDCASTRPAGLRAGLFGEVFGTTLHGHEDWPSVVEHIGLVVVPGLHPARAAARA